MRRLGWGVLSLCVLYWGGLNALLATPLPEALFNLVPHSAQIHYSRAWTVVPLRFEVRDLRVSIQDRLVQVAIAADAARGDLRPWALRELRFVGKHLVGEGVTFRLRPRMSVGDPREAFITELPPIPGYEEVVRDVSAHEVQAKDIRYISIDLSDVTIHHLREIWIDRVRYTGAAEVSGGMLYEPFRRLRLDDVHFADANAVLVAVEPHAATFQALEFEVNLADSMLDTFGFAELVRLDGHLTLAGTTDPGFLNAYLSNVPGSEGLRLEGNSGPLSLKLAVRRGRVADGARLSYSSSDVSAQFPWFGAVGDLDVTGAATGGRLAVEAVVSDAAVRRGSLVARAPRVSLSASSDASLPQLPLMTAVLSLEGARLGDLRQLDEVLPPSAGLRVAKGTGRIDAKLWLDPKPARAHGVVSLAAKDVVVRSRAATISGQLTLEARVRAFDFASGALDVSGSTLHIDDATVSDGLANWKDQWLHARLARGVHSPRGKLPWISHVELGASNLQPLYALIAANVELPRAAGLFADSPNVRLVLDLQAQADGLSLPAVTLTSQTVRLEGAVMLRPSPRMPELLQPWGGVVVHVGLINVGVQFAGDQVSVVAPREVPVR